MPELPEVESLRRDLEATLVGHRFASVDVRLPKQVVTPTGLSVADLIGKRIERLRRMGYLAPASDAPPPAAAPGFSLESAQLMPAVADATSRRPPPAPPLDGGGPG